MSAEGGPYFHPTKRNIQAGLKWLVKDCKAGDSLVFYFSGHGLRQPDFDNDELDGFDETICPLDFKTAGVILDNEINDTIVRPLKPGVRLHAIVDSCHSGTILDLSFIYNLKEYVQYSVIILTSLFIAFLLSFFSWLNLVVHKCTCIVLQAIGNTMSLCTNKLSHTKLPS